MGEGRWFRGFQVDSLFANIPTRFDDVTPGFSAVSVPIVAMTEQSKQASKQAGEPRNETLGLGWRFAARVFAT
jgi:hypothetical protein